MWKQGKTFLGEKNLRLKFSSVNSTSLLTSNACGGGKTEIEEDSNHNLYWGNVLNNEFCIQDRQVYQII